MLKKLFKKEEKVLETPHFESLKDYDVVIHIGAPKTGSSALQKFFKNNKRVLEKNNFYYPEHALDKNGISGGHSLLAIALLENRINDAKEMFEKWYDHSKNVDKTLLLSSESFFNLSNKMKKIIGDKKILVISYQRDIVDYLLSVHNQLIKRHHSTLNFEDYIKSLLNKDVTTANLINKSFSSSYKDWEDYVGSDSLVVRPYSKEHFKNGKIEFDILDILQVSSKEFILDESKTNVSYTQEATELKRMLNHILDPNEQKLNHKIDTILQKYSDANLNIKEKNVLPLSEDIFKNLSDFIKEDIYNLNKKYLNNKLKLKNYELKYVKYNNNEINKIFNLVQKDDDIKQYLYESLTKRLSSKKNLNFSIYKLAEMLDIENLYLYEQSPQQDYWFNQHQLNNMAEGKYKEADFLRDIAVLLTNRGDTHNAYKLICKALELRPKGPFIQKFKKEMEQLL